MPFRRYSLTKKGVDLVNKNWLPWQVPYNKRSNFSQSSTIPANFVKIGPVDVEITGLTEITKLHGEAEKRNQFASVCIILILDRIMAMSLWPHI